MSTHWWCQNSLLIDAAEVKGKKKKKTLLLLTMDGGLELPQFNDKPVKSINLSIIQGLINLWAIPLSSPVLPWYLLLDYFLKYTLNGLTARSKEPEVANLGTYIQYCLFLTCFLIFGISFFCFLVSMLHTLHISPTLPKTYFHGGCIKLHL